jgi:hypothetical protein
MEYQQEFKRMIIRLTNEIKESANKYLTEFKDYK